MVEIGSSLYTTQYLQQDLKNSSLAWNQSAMALIGRASKVMLKILQKQIVPMIESVLVDCQVVIRAGRSTVEQVTYLRILCQKYIELD